MAPRPAVEPPRRALGDQMTIAEFLAFTATRPDEEHWELIEGEPVLNASPVNAHQTVCGNILVCLANHRRAVTAPWFVTLGIGTRVPLSPRSLPRPDVYVHGGPTHFDHLTDDALVIFEVPSRSNRKADQLWRCKVYASVPNCRQYVTVSLRAAEITAYDRATGWQPRAVAGRTATLDLPALGTALPLADVYADTPIGT
jgi:hypothetical protein